MVQDAFQEIMKAVRDNTDAGLEEALSKFTKKQIIDFIREMEGAGVFSEMAQMYADYCEVYPDEDDEDE